MKQESSFSYSFYYYIVLFFTLVALINTVYLSWLHYKNYTDITFSSFCALSNSFNCDTVSQSPWSLFLNMPVSYWGFFAYLIYLTLLIRIRTYTNEGNSLWYLLFYLIGLYSLVSLIFGYISSTKISSHCILCLVNHTICLVLLFLNYLVVNRFCKLNFLNGLKNSFLFFYKSVILRYSILIIFILFVSTKVSLPQYWLFTTPSLPSSSENYGLTEEGNPWIGSSNAKITIHEYSDYLCFQCSKMHLMLRRIIATNPESIKLVHHHYPLDHEFNNIVVPEPFHVGSGKMAMIAIYATANNKFWLMNDALYTAGRGKTALRLKLLAEETGFSVSELAAAAEHPKIRERLLYDIQKGMKLGITGTPSYVIDGAVYTGSIPSNILKSITR